MLAIDSEASTVHLKNGQQVDGEIVERLEDRVIVKQANGGTAPYWLDEISKIDESAPAAPPPTEESAAQNDTTPATAKPSAEPPTQPGDYAQVQAYLQALGSVMQSVSQAAWNAPNQLPNADPAQLKALAEKMLPLIDQGLATMQAMTIPESCRSIHALSVSILTFQQQGYRALRDGDQAQATKLFLQGLAMQKQLMEEGEKLLQRYEPGQSLFGSAPNINLPPVDAAPKPETPEERAAAAAYSKEYLAIMQPLQQSLRQSFAPIKQAIARKDLASLRQLVQDNLTVIRAQHAKLSGLVPAPRFARLHALSLAFLQANVDGYEALLTGDVARAEPKMSEMMQLASQYAEEGLRLDRLYPNEPRLAPLIQEMSPAQ